jgi:hypothetical protein
MGAPAGGGQAQGGTLPQQVQGAYGSALGQYGSMGGTGANVLNAAGQAGQQSQGLFNEMGGMKPGEISAGQLSNTNLQPYMDPYNQNVIDQSMNELNRQEGVQQQGIDDQFAQQNAFGGDRMYLQKGVLGGKFGDVKSKMLADLYSKNFLNAQQMGQYDINNRLAADTTNQGIFAQLYGGAAQGLGNLAANGMQTGGNLMGTGAQGLGNLAASGFQMANTANASQTAAAQAAQQQQQQAIDAANANYARLLGIPESYLASMLGISSGLGNFGTTKTNAQADPGAISQVGAGVGILSQLAGIGIG